MWSTKKIIVTLLVTIFLLGIIPIIPSYAILPDASCYGQSAVTGTGNTTVSCTLTAVSGERLIVLIGEGSNTAQTYSFPKPSDSLSSGFSNSPLVPTTTDYQKFSGASIWNGSAASSGLDTITGTCGITAGGGGNGLCIMFVYMIPYLPTIAVVTGTGSCRNTIQTNCANNLNSTITPTAGYNSFVAGLALIQFSPQTTLSAGSGFTLDSNSNTYAAGTSFGQGAEYVTGTASTNVPFSATASSTQTWVEVAVAIPTSQITTTITFAETGIQSGFGNGILVINNTVYSVAQLPLSFTYTASNSSNTINYGYFSSVSGQAFQSASGCSTNKDGNIKPSSTGTCTLTASYAFSSPNGCTVCSAIINQIVSVIVFLVPSLFTLFIFLVIGTKVLGLHGDSLVLIVIVGLAVITTLSGLLGGQIVPVWIGIITTIFAIMGFIYFKTINK